MTPSLIQLAALAQPTHLCSVFPRQQTQYTLSQDCKTMPKKDKKKGDKKAKDKEEDEKEVEKKPFEAPDSTTKELELRRE